MIAMETVVEAFRHLNPTLYLNSKENALITDVVLACDCHGGFKPSLLYLCSAAELQLFSNVMTNLNLLCLANEDIPNTFLESDHINLIVVSASINISELYKETDAFISEKLRVIQGEKKFCEALISGRGLQHIVNVSLEVLGNPFFVSDISFKILAHTNTEVDDLSWNEAINTEYKYNDITKQLRKSSEIEKLYHSENPVLSEFNYSKYRWLACRIMVAGKVIGHTAIIEYLRPLQKSDYELLKFFCKTLASEIQKDNFPNHSQGVKYEFFLADLLDEKFPNRKSAEERMKIINLKFKEHLYVLVARLSPTAPGNTSIPYIRNLMERMVNDSKTIIYHNEIVMIISRQINNPLSRADLESILVFLADNQINCGLSRCFRNISDLKEHFLQASKAIDLGTRMDSDNDLYFYEDYSLYHFMELAAGQKDIVSFCSPLLTELREYDKKNMTDYTKSLYVYLICGGDLQKAADKFKIHRNSMNYRINKIAALLDVSFNDPEVIFSLYLSYKILLFNEGKDIFIGKTTKLSDF